MTVHLVGAGPGDPGLLTRRGAALLGVAGAVVHDRLVDPGVLDLAHPSAERFDVGKWPGSDEGSAQDEINELLVRLAARHAVVVRLKGGDPFVFGRGGEELAYLRERGIDVEVVPGVSSAFAVPALAGIPVTLRGVATAVLVTTGHEVAGSSVDWGLAAQDAVTVVVLMGMGHRDELARALVAAGRSAETPAAVIHRGSSPEERCVVTTVGELGAVELPAPAVIVIGAVVGSLAPAQRRPVCSAQRA